ncbi:Ferrochelatase [Rickettsiales bacterium Ac37b]|nr:Ferrochelatase [Rickettsiales bacterium Ac37b]
MEKLAVVIFNLGGPTEEKEIKSFLFSLFYDKYILRIPNPFRWILAKFITVKRIKKAKDIYDKIGGGSPILSETNKQAEALYKKMIEYNCSNKEFNVFVSMRHSKPLISDTIEKLKDYNPDQIFLIPLYPQYSSTTTRSFIEEFLKISFKNNIKSSIKYLCCYPDAHKFIDAYIQLIKIKYEQAKLLGNPKIIFSAHSLPKRIIEKGDPYQWQVEYTVQKIIDKLKIEYNLDWVISYQSRVGYSKWLTPYTEEEIIKASHQHFPIILVPITFVSEHSETLVELDIIYKDIARQNGCIGYFRVETLRNSELFIEYLAETCIKLLNSNSGRISRICPEQFKECIF